MQRKRAFQDEAWRQDINEQNDGSDGSIIAKTIGRHDGHLYICTGLCSCQQSVVVRKA
jgi:hypothetical protein